MPYRTFADDQGKSWEMWDVRPERIERRGADRREEQAAWTGPERRAAADRRERSEVRIRLSEPMSSGWLVFKSGEEKRRLAPIPANWESCRTQELRALFDKAYTIDGRIEEQRPA